MASHNVTCHPAQVKSHRLNASRIGRYSIYLPRSDEKLSWPKWLVTYRDGSPAHRQSPIQVLTRPSVEQLRGSDNVLLLRHATNCRNCIILYVAWHQSCCRKWSMRFINCVTHVGLRNRTSLLLFCVSYASNDVRPTYERCIDAEIY